MDNEKEKDINTQEEFESEQNLLGLFAILFAVDRRINPENYESVKNEKQND